MSARARPTPIGVSRCLLLDRLPAVLAALLALLTLCASPTPASTIRQLNLEDLARRADRIFSGRVLEVRVERDPALRQVVTRTTLAVTRGARGNLPGRLTITTLGGQDAGSSGPGEEPAGAGPGGQRRPSISGMPSFRKGEEVVLFLYADSRSGLTSPVGFGQGKFSVVPDKNGRRLAINGFGNRNLFRGLSARAEARIGAPPTPGRDRRAIHADELLDLVEALLAPSPSPAAGGARGGSP